jgi:ribosomal protein L11 methyltransferase
MVDSSDQVNWEEQWALFAENFHDGMAHIDLKKFGGKKTLLLKPGPGFGDLSHPTTYLMLQLLQKYVQEHSVIDIGCGSGILSLAALLLGAHSALGIDIDKEAVSHAKKNQALNDLSARFATRLPRKLKKGNLGLMNMILSEQEIVMQDHLRLNGLMRLWITSGILVKQRKKYLEKTKEWGWKLVEEATRGEWLGMVFAQV